MPRPDLSLAEARRIALRAHGFARPRPKRAGKAQLARVIRELGQLQLDFVNVLVPAHYQVPFSRLGPYAREKLDDVVYRSGGFTERWAREASVVPVETWPLLRYRMDVHQTRRGGFDRFIEDNPSYLDRVVAEIRKRGPLAPEDLPEPGRTPARASGWSAGKAVLEHLFGRGVVGAADRRPNFSRTYDLSERLVPREHFRRRVPKEEAQRALLEDAARAQGIGSVADLADDYRIPMSEARPRVAELVEAKALREVRVEGWREPAYLHPKAKPAARAEAATLVSPFDPLMRHRDRALRLFDFDYRIEIFLPAAQRKWGYYILPFLLGERIVAKVDLKAERAARELRVAASYLEPPAKASEVVGPLAEELRTWAAWLGLERIRVAPKGNLARALRRAL